MTPASVAQGMAQDRRPCIVASPFLRLYLFGGVTNVDFGVFPGVLPSNDPCKTLGDILIGMIASLMIVSNFRPGLIEGGAFFVAGLFFYGCFFSMFSYNT